MNPALLSLALVVISVPLMFLNVLLPSINVHLAQNREIVLRESVQQIVDSNRLAPNNIAPLVRNLRINGVAVDNVSVSPQGQYINVDVSYRYTRLFLNKFFTNNDRSRRKTINIVIDKVI